MVVEWKAHIHDLAKQHGISLDIQVNKNWYYSGYRRDIRCVMGPEVTGPVSYIALMHEFGHSQDPDLSENIQEIYTLFHRYGLMNNLTKEIILIREMEAWQWAIRNALHWQPVMGRVVYVALNSYMIRMKKLESRISYRYLINMIMAYEQLFRMTVYRLARLRPDLSRDECKLRVRMVHPRLLRRFLGKIDYKWRKHGSRHRPAEVA